jgi:hypothetical protein
LAAVARQQVAGQSSFGVYSHLLQRIDWFRLSIKGLHSLQLLLQGASRPSYLANSWHTFE